MTRSKGQRRAVVSGGLGANDQLTAGVVDGSSFTDGELPHLLDGRPNFEAGRTTSHSYERKTISHIHPNLRHLGLRFTLPKDPESVDILFMAAFHSVSMERIDTFQDTTDTVVGLSADFHFSGAAQYGERYNSYVCPECLEKLGHTFPELNRENLPDMSLITAGNYSTTVAILSLEPPFGTGILAGDEQIAVDMRVDSSRGGTDANKMSSHAKRPGIVRPYAPTGHRHEAGTEKHLGLPVSFAVHTVDMIRSAAAICHVFPDGSVSESDIWKASHGSYGGEPFVYTVVDSDDVYRYPEPGSVAEASYGEVGFGVDPGNWRPVVSSAIDNMIKGSVGQAVHAVSTALGLDETAGFNFTDFRPIGSP